MRISGTHPVAAPARTVEPAARVVRSEFAQELREAARTAPGGDLRTEVVARARADIAAGRLGSETDIERAIDALLRGF
jgi:hypothetical protein